MDSIFQKIKADIAQKIETVPDFTDERLLEWIESAVLHASQNDYFPYAQKREMIMRVFHAFRGLDVLQPLIEDPSITEIMVNRHDEIFIERFGEIASCPIQFESEEKLQDVIQSIVGKINRTVNESNPIVDARLADGSRVHVVLPPVALNGPTLTVRKFPERAMSLADLVEKGALNEEAAEFLRKMVVCGYNLFISGGTGSGKTTLLNALADCIPPTERVIIIEDSAELNVSAVPNLVRLETRNPNTEGKGGISIRDLIRASLRMRPNRIIVGEVRGAEALDMLQAMNTGHDGSLSTGHANSVTDMISRLETMVHSAADLPLQVIRKQIGSAIDIMVHLSRMRDRSRKIVEISELVKAGHEEMAVNPLYLYRDRGECPDGSLSGSLEATGHVLVHTYKLEMAGFRSEICPSR